MAKSYEHLDIWKDGMKLSSGVYRITKKFPKTEMFGMVSQLRRAAVSIPVNIAEGSGRASKKDFSRFIDIAIGSLNEVECLLQISLQLSYIGKSDHDVLMGQVKPLGGKLGNFRKYLKK